MQVIRNFWVRQPALLYGLTFLIGVYASFEINGLLFLLASLLLIPLYPSHRLFLSLFLIFTSYIYSSQMAQHPEIPSNGLQGTATFSPHVLQQKSSSIGRQWNYYGIISQFETSDHSLVLHNISSTVRLPDTKKISRPVADKAYQIAGRLKKTEKGSYFFVPEKHQPWIPLNNSWKAAEWRFQLKRHANNIVKSRFQQEPTKSFLAGIATGEFENLLLGFEFSRFGLQHIMAISGFHFAIVSGLLCFFLTRFLSPKISIISLITLMTLYYLFLGNGPSIMRAWISCLIGYLSLLFENPPSGLNSLGIGLLIILIADPEMAKSIGFQFSFIVTAGILLFFSPLDHCLKEIFPVRTFEKALTMNTPNQHGFIVITLLRQAIALSLSVNVVALPLTLFYFGKFPLMSILYNFFFPWLVSASMFLLMVGLIFDLVSIGHWIHRMNEYFTQFMLDYTHQMPRSLDIYLHASPSKDFIILFYIVIFIAGMYLRHHFQNNTQQELLI